MKQIDIAELVSWALNEQAAGQYDNIMRRAAAGYLSSTAIVTETLRLGCQVDAQSGYLKRIGAKCHPDAIAVYEAIQELDEPARTLVLAHGKARTEPDWTIWPEIRPKRHVGNHKVVVETDYDARGKIVAQWCPLDIFPSLDLVSAAREAYSDWWNGLATLRKRLVFRLCEHVVTGPVAPESPWL